MLKSPPAMRRLGFHPWIRKMPWRRKSQPSPVFLSGKSHGQRSLAGYSPWGHKESDTTEHTQTHTYICISYQKWSHTLYNALQPDFLNLGASLYILRNKFYFGISCMPIPPLSDQASVVSLISCFQHFIITAVMNLLVSNIKSNYSL